MQRALVWLPVAVMLVIAVRHHVLVRKEGLTQWDGGGFGMFSTIESPPLRPVRVSLVSGEGSFRASVPSAERRLLARIRAMPTQERLRSLAAALAEKTWVPSTHRSFGEPAAQAPGPVTYRALGPGESPPDSPGPVFTRLRIEVLRCRLDTTREVLVAEPWRSEEIVLTLPQSP